MRRLDLTEESPSSLPRRKEIRSTSVSHGLESEQIKEYWSFMFEKLTNILK